MRYVVLPLSPIIFILFIMVTIQAIPSLGTQGFVTDAVNKFDLALSHFYLADYNQTYLYPGNVSSLAKLMQEFDNDIPGLINGMQRTLSIYFLKYYSDCNVNITIVNPANAEIGSKVELKLVISVIDNNKESIYGRILEAENGKFKNIIKLNNFG